MITYIIFLCVIGISLLIGYRIRFEGRLHKILYEIDSSSMVFFIVFYFFLFCICCYYWVICVVSLIYAYVVLSRCSCNALVSSFSWIGCGVIINNKICFSFYIFVFEILIVPNMKTFIHIYLWLFSSGIIARFPLGDSLGESLGISVEVPLRIFWGFIYFKLSNENDK